MSNDVTAPVAGSVAVTTNEPVASHPTKKSDGVNRTTAVQLSWGASIAPAQEAGQVDPGSKPKPKSSGNPPSTRNCSGFPLALVIFTLSK